MATLEAVDLGRAEQQLAAINELVALADELEVPVWLRGGWAMDFYLGHLTRDHDDIDWFALASDGPELTHALIGRGFTDVTATPTGQQIDLIRGDVEHGIALVRLGEQDEPLVGGGPWAREPWPRGMLDGPVGSVGKISARVIGPLAQIEIKRMTPSWNPKLKRRGKDVRDIAALERGLGVASASHPDPDRPGERSRRDAQ